MIQPTEYRIGNIVYWNPALTHPGTTLPRVYLEIASIAIDKVGYFSPGLEHRSEPFMDDQIQSDTKFKNVEDLEPVPITDSLLRDAVLPEMLNGDLDEMEIVFNTTKSCFYYNGKRISVKAEYLHQLQNIYYALTGKELQVKLQSLL